MDGPALTVVGGGIGGGTDRPAAEEAGALAEFALDLAENVAVWVSGRWGGVEALAMGIGLRQGLACGSAGGGLVGYHRFGYQMWGPAVSDAESLCEAATLNTVACSDEARAVLPSTAEEVAAVFPSGGARCVFRFDHRIQNQANAQPPRARRYRGAAAASDHHTLLERDVVLSEAVSDGRSSSTRSLVSVELGFSPTPTPGGHTPHPPLPHIPDPIYEEVEDIEEDEEEEVSRPESTGGFAPVSPSQPRQIEPTPPAAGRTTRAGRRSYAGRSVDRPASTGGGTDGAELQPVLP